MKTKILAVILAVAMLVSMLPMSAVVSAAGSDFTEDFADISEWETVIAHNYQGIDSTSMGTVAYSTTYEDGKTVLYPTVTKNKNRMSAITTIKDDNWVTDKRVSKVTAAFLTNSALSNGNTVPGVYAMHINQWNSVAITVYHNGTNFYYQWWRFGYSETATNNGYTSLTQAKAVSVSEFTSNAEWMTLELTYDYSKIESNQLIINARLGDGTNWVTLNSYMKTTIIPLF